MKELMRWFMLVTGFPIYALFFKTKVYYEDETRENKRIKGAALIVSNHYSGLDYMITLFHYFGRKVYVVMLEYIFKRSAFLRHAISIIGGIRADRDVMGMRFMDEAVACLRRGKLVQIYPEAHNTTDGLIHDFKRSYVLIALRADVPIVPIAVDGNYGLFKKAHAIIGRSIRLSDYVGASEPTREQIEELNEMVRTKVIALRSQLSRRIEEDKRK